MALSNDFFVFLKQLEQNNNREWFNTNKQIYDKLKKEFEKFINELIPQIIEIDNQIPFCEAKDCMFRIHRDTRFSPDKTPYKTNFGAYITKGGRKSCFPGYYIHIEADNKSLIAGGLYMPPSDILKNAREIIVENYNEFIQIVENEEFKKFFGQIEGEKLKTAPKGFPKDFIGIEYLKFKSLSVAHFVNNSIVTSNDFVNQILYVSRVMKPFNQFLQKAFL